MDRVLNVRCAAAPDGWNWTACKHWRQVEVHLVNQRSVEGFSKNPSSTFQKNACNAAPS